MIANILQLAAGILLAISSFIVKDTFQVPVFGEKLPGLYEKFKQVWIIRIGLMLLAAGYALPIFGWDINLLKESSGYYRLLVAFGFTAIVVLIAWSTAVAFAKSAYKKAPVLDENSPGLPGMIALSNDDE